MSEALPTIDVPFLRLLDWLADRGFLAKQWRSSVKALQLRAEEAGKALPLDVQAELGVGSNYEYAKKVRDKLSETSGRNFLGYCTGPAAGWDKLVRAYEKHNLQVGEAAAIAVRLGEFEIPFLQNQISKHQQQLVDIEKKEVECAKNITKARKAYLQECENLNIQGSDVVKELQNLTAELPGLYLNAAKKLKSPWVSQAIDYYSQFLQYISQAAGSNLSTPDVFPVLSEILQSDLELPGTPLNPGVKLDLPLTTSAQTLDPEPLTTDGAGIQQDIDWDIALDEEFEGQESKQESPSGPPAEGRIESGIVERLVDDNAFRASTMLEISELAAFVDHRCSELNSHAHSVLIAAAPEGIQQVALPSLTEMAAALADCQEAFSTERVKQLLGLKTSSQYLQRIAASLLQKASQESKHYRMQKELESRKREVQARLVEDAPKLTNQKESLLELKVFLGDQISKLLQGRKVRLVGEINSLLEK